MSVVTETPRGWSFIHKGQRYEYPTRQQAQEALYDLQRGIICRAVDAVLAP